MTRTVNNKIRLCCLFLGIMSTAFSLQAQDSLLNKKRLRTFAITSGAAYTVALIGLNEVWYQEAPGQSFQWFDDNAEWKQVDKLGHFYSAFHFSQLIDKGLRWSNVSHRKAAWIGAVGGFAILLPIEILDGHSAAYGASSGDLVANAAGSLFFLGQKSLWHEVRIIPKFSFQRTGYAQMRPNVLGEQIPSEILKDYNGQTHWLSFDLDKFFQCPKWLNIAVGYGADGMIYARDYQNQQFGFNPVREYYLGIDIDLTGIRTRSKVLKAALSVINTIHLPAPTLRLSQNRVTAHPFFF